jgi:hypothetical protein
MAITTLRVRVKTITPFTEFWRNLSPQEKEDLARRAGSTKASISLMARGHRRAGIKLIEKLTAADNRITLSMLRDVVRVED